ncbi:MAG TPA: Ig-like domain-containing protein [bacterium]|nr:Ig-like domain-containing protein [bacterium]
MLHTLPILILVSIFSLFFLMSDCDCDDDDDDNDDSGGGDDDDDNDTDDDLIDDDIFDDDTSDDDFTPPNFVIGDDDDATPPEEITVFPADEQTDVPLNTIVYIQSTEALDPEDFAFTLTDGAQSVEGFAQYSFDYSYYYYYPDQLLAEDTQYAVRFTMGGVDYETTFSTIVSAGEIDLPGNAGGGPGEYFSFIIEPDEILQPAALEQVILLGLSQIDLMVAPVFVETISKETGTLTLSGGEARDFDGDDIWEQNFAALGTQYAGQIAGDRLAMSGSFPLYLRDVEIDIDLFFLSGRVELDEYDHPTLPEAMVALATYDCEGLSEAFPYMVPLVNLICDEENGMFALATFHGTYNALEDLFFDAPDVTADRIEVNFDPPQYLRTPDPVPGNALFEVYQGEQLIVTSRDNEAGVEFPDCCTQLGPEWFSFSEVAYQLPDGVTLAPGSYTLKFHLGMYGFEADFDITARAEADGD